MIGHALEPITTPSLWVFGGGHVSRALCQVAALAGFRVTVTDDRETFASAQRFPWAACTVAAPFADTVASMPLRANTYVVIVTRGHKEDGLVLEALAARAARGERAKFLGMIGSTTTRAVLFRHLRAAGVDAGFLDTVRSPVGLSLGARSHEEIAVAVVGELIQVRRTGHDAAEAWEARRRAPRAPTPTPPTPAEP